LRPQSTHAVARRPRFRFWVYRRQRLPQPHAVNLVLHPLALQQQFSQPPPLGLVVGRVGDHTQDALRHGNLPVNALVAKIGLGDYHGRASRMSVFMSRFISSISACM
jgi:hypothetical protein